MTTVALTGVSTACRVGGINLYNTLVNSNLTGAVVGSPGTVPTNWPFVGTGLTEQIAGTGTLPNGQGYVDIRVSGSGSSVNVSLSQGVAVTPNVSYTMQTALQVITSSTNVGFYLDFDFYTSNGGTYLTSIFSQQFIGTTLVNCSLQGTAPSNATYAICYPCTIAPNGGAVDCTLRMVYPTFGHTTDGVTQTKLTPSGVSTTSQTGIFPLSKTVALTGLSSTTAIGAISKATALPLSGVAITTNAGSLGYTVNKILSGVSASAMIGTTTTAENLMLSGVAINGGVGSTQITSNMILALTGISSQSNVGIAVVNTVATVAVTGLAIIGALSALTITANSSTTSSPTGVSTFVRTGQALLTQSFTLSGTQITSTLAPLFPQPMSHLASNIITSATGLLTTTEFYQIDGVKITSNSGIILPISQFVFGLLGVQMQTAINGVTITSVLSPFSVIFAVPFLLMTHLTNQFIPTKSRTIMLVNEIRAIRLPTPLASVALPSETHKVVLPKPYNKIVLNG